MPTLSLGSFGSLEFSLGEGKPSVKRGLTSQWTSWLVGRYKAIRKDAFASMGRELKDLFERAQNDQARAELKHNLNCKNYEEALAERIKNGMLKHNFQMPEGHERWCYLDWQDIWQHAKGPYTYNAKLFIRMDAKWGDQEKSLIIYSYRFLVTEFNYVKVPQESVHRGPVGRARAASVGSTLSEAETLVPEPTTYHTGGSSMSASARSVATPTSSTGMASDSTPSTA
jgi:hypothetical protein